MKNKILSILSIAFAFLVGGILFFQTHNAVAAGAGVFLTSYVANTAFDLTSPIQGLFCTLSHVRKAPCGTPNPGGGNKLWLAPVDQFDEAWGQTATAGVIQAGPDFKVGFTGWVELDVSDNSLKLDQMLKGVAGYQVFENGIEVKIAGDTEGQTAAVEKLINTEVVAVIQLNDMQRKNVGSTLFPLTFEISHTTGAKGSDQRGWTFKAKNDGLSKPSYFLKSDIALTIAP